MPDDARPLNTHPIKDSAIAATRSLEEAQRRHLDLVDRHAKIDRAIRKARSVLSRASGEDKLVWAVQRSRELIDESVRVLAETKKNVRYVDRR